MGKIMPNTLRPMECLLDNIELAGYCNITKIQLQTAVENMLDRNYRLFASSFRPGAEYYCLIAGKLVVYFT